MSQRSRANHSSVAAVTASNSTRLSQPLSLIHISRALGHSVLYLRKSNMRLALKLFRGEPAISGFDWNFSAIHTLSLIHIFYFFQ